MKKILNLTEQWRYKFDMTEAIIAFVDVWAFGISGVMPPKNPICNESIFKQAAIPLTHLLHDKMMSGDTDPLGFLLSELYQENVKNNAFYPTPPALSALLSELTPTTATSTIHETCCGTGSIILTKIEKIYTDNLNLDNPLSEISVIVEDINITALKCFFIQLVHKLNYLKETYHKNSSLKEVKIIHVDSLSQKNPVVIYDLGYQEDNT